MMRISCPLHPRRAFLQATAAAGGAIKALNALRARLPEALRDPNTPPYVYTGLKREQVLRTGSVVLHEAYPADTTPILVMDMYEQQRASRSWTWTINRYFESCATRPTRASARLRAPQLFFAVHDPVGLLPRAHGGNMPSILMTASATSTIRLF